ncbi:MAG: tryptophan-rich sensory protein [Methanospirillaceae archaeon]|nr:tryptophan-rich sensory protein [Methanospirillaceae archaeon]
MILQLSIAVILCVLLGSLGGFFTGTGPGSWYESIEKPSFNPPGWIFAPMWTFLFILMGISLFLVWDCGIARRDVQIAIAVFGIQFLFNILWSFFFFGLESPILGLIDIIILDVMIIATIGCFYRVRKKAAYLLIPYLAWVCFATILNFMIYHLNP